MKTGFMNQEDEYYFRPWDFSILEMGYHHSFCHSNNLFVLEIGGSKMMNSAEAIKTRS